MSVLNKKETRRLIFARLNEIRPALVGKMTRVSERTYSTLEYKLRVAIDRALEVHGTVGSTLDLE